jgi:hypothetical protein
LHIDTKLQNACQQPSSGSPAPETRSNSHGDFHIRTELRAEGEDEIEGVTTLARARFHPGPHGSRDGAGPSTETPRRNTTLG